MKQIIPAAIKTMVVKALLPKKGKAQVLNGWSKAFFDKIDNLKFLGYVGADGYPVIIPLIQAQSLDAEHMVFSFGAFGGELEQIPAFTPVAVFGMALTMEDVLVRGTYQGSKRVLGMKCGVVQLDYAYNPMPPKPAADLPGRAAGGGAGVLIINYIHITDGFIRNLIFKVSMIVSLYAAFRVGSSIAR